MGFKSRTLALKRRLTNKNQPTPYDMRVKWEKQVGKSRRFISSGSLQDLSSRKLSSRRILEILDDATVATGKYSHNDSSGQSRNVEGCTFDESRQSDFDESRQSDFDESRQSDFDFDESRQSDFDEDKDYGYSSAPESTQKERGGIAGPLYAISRSLSGIFSTGSKVDAGDDDLNSYNEDDQETAMAQILTYAESQMSNKSETSRQTEETEESVVTANETDAEEETVEEEPVVLKAVRKKGKKVVRKQGKTESAPPMQSMLCIPMMGLRNACACGQPPENFQSNSDDSMIADSFVEENTDESEQESEQESEHESESNGKGLKKKRRNGKTSKKSGKKSSSSKTKPKTKSKSKSKSETKSKKKSRSKQISAEAKMLKGRAMSIQSRDSAMSIHSSRNTTFDGTNASTIANEVKQFHLEHDSLAIHRNNLGNAAQDNTTFAGSTLPSASYFGSRARSRSRGGSIRRDTFTHDDATFGQTTLPSMTDSYRSRSRGKSRSAPKSRGISRSRRGKLIGNSIANSTYASTARDKINQFHVEHDSVGVHRRRLERGDEDDQRDNSRSRRGKSMNVGNSVGNSSYASTARDKVNQFHVERDSIAVHRRHLDDQRENSIRPSMSLGDTTIASTILDDLRELNTERNTHLQYHRNRSQSRSRRKRTEDPSSRDILKSLSQFEEQRDIHMQYERTRSVSRGPKRRSVSLDSRSSKSPSQRDIHKEYERTRSRSRGPKRRSVSRDSSSSKSRSQSPPRSRSRGQNRERGRSRTVSAHRNRNKN